MRSFFRVFLPVLLASTASHAVPISGGPAEAWVYARSDTTGGSGLALTFDTESLTDSTTGSQENGTGTASVSAFLGNGEPGYLKGTVSAQTDGCCLAGQAGLRVGVNSIIWLDGPEDTAGSVAVTMTFTGSYGGPGDGSQILLQSGPGIDTVGVGFASGDPEDRGLFRLTDSFVYGRSYECLNCTYSATDVFPISITAYLPFEAGAEFVRYSAQIDLYTSALIGGTSFIEGFNTALFSISVPQGFTYTSPLNFVNDDGDVPTIPVPPTGLLFALGLASIAWERRRASARRNVPATSVFSQVQGTAES
jgi:hypothetical protein